MGIELIAIGTGTPEMATTFAKEQGFKGRRFVDQKKSLYKALLCRRGETEKKKKNEFHQRSSP